MRIVGSNRGEYIYGTWFDDQIYAKSGHDTVEGGTGNDWIGGGNGDDYLVGDDGTDVLYGHAGNDELESGTGYQDQLFGGPGNDHLVSVKGSYSYCYGGAGNDTFYSPEIDEDWPYDQDHLYGGNGNDLFQVRGDWAEGGPGRDQFLQYSYHNEVNWLTGGRDADDFDFQSVLDGETSTSIIVDKQPGDTLSLRLEIQIDGSGVVTDIPLTAFDTDRNGKITDDDGPGLYTNSWVFHDFSAGTGTPWSSLFLQAGDDLIAFNGVTELTAPLVQTPVDHIF